MSVLDPLSHALATVVATAHSAVTARGADPDGAAAWLLSIAAVVVLVRLALLPLVVRGVRQAHAAARARPHLQRLSDQYREQLAGRDPDTLRAYLEERRRLGAEHGVSRLGCLPTLAQIPVWMSLYHLLAQVAGGTAVGALTPALVVSFGAATVLGVPLAAHGYAGAGAHLAVVAGLAGTASSVGPIRLVCPRPRISAASGTRLRISRSAPSAAAARARTRPRRARRGAAARPRRRR